jgi:hypothetical protein
VQQLVVRVTELERQRNAALSQLASISQSALDPSSELASLLSQLSSGTPQDKGKAVEALFQLKDPRSLPELNAFFRKDPEAAGMIRNLAEWYSLFYELNQRSAVQFMIDQLESNARNYADWAFDILEDKDSRWPLSIEVRQYVVTQLESLALRSQETTVRTRAKILLKEIRARLATKPKS